MGALWGSDSSYTGLVVLQVQGLGEEQVLCLAGSSPWPGPLSQPSGRITADLLPAISPAHCSLTPEAVWLCVSSQWAESRRARPSPGRAQVALPLVVSTVGAPLCLSRPWNLEHLAPVLPLHEPLDSFRNVDVIAAARCGVGGGIYEWGLSARAGLEGSRARTCSPCSPTTRHHDGSTSRTHPSRALTWRAAAGSGIHITQTSVALSTSLEHRVFLKCNIFSDSWEAFRRFPAFGHNLLFSYLPNKTNLTELTGETETDSKAENTTVNFQRLIFKGKVWVLGHLCRSCK